MWTVVRERGKPACSRASSSLPPSLHSLHSSYPAHVHYSLITFLHIPFGRWFACLCFPLSGVAHPVDVFDPFIPLMLVDSFHLLPSLLPSLPSLLQVLPSPHHFNSIFLRSIRPLPFPSLLSPPSSFTFSSASSLSLTACFPAIALHVL